MQIVNLTKGAKNKDGSPGLNFDTLRELLVSDEESDFIITDVDDFMLGNPFQKPT